MYACDSDGLSESSKGRWTAWPASSRYVVLTQCMGPPGLQVMTALAPGTEQRSSRVSTKSGGMSVTSSKRTPAKLGPRAFPSLARSLPMKP